MDTLSDPRHYMPDETKLVAIRQHIDEYNAERPTIQWRAYLQVGVLMGCYIAVLLLIFYLMARSGNHSKHNPMGYVFAGVAMCGWWIWSFAWKPVKDLQLSLRYRLFPVIFGFIDKVQYSNGYSPGFLGEIRRLKLVHFSSSENDDLISGTHDGLSFEMVESKLMVGGKNKTAAFRGLIFRFTLDTEFPGLLVAARRGNWLQQFVRNMFGGDADMIASGDWEIDQTHEFHTDNYAAAKPLVEGPLAAALKYLKREWWAGEARIALRNRECFLMLPADRDYFALPGIASDVDYKTDIEPMIREMVTLLAVAHLIRKVGMPERTPPDQSASDTI